MTLDVLSSIKGAEASKVVDNLFEVIKKGHISNTNTNNTTHVNAVNIDDLRPDEVIKSSELEQHLILENFPNKKNRFLVVPKVIEE